jgi:hypothetical protein
MRGRGEAGHVDADLGDQLGGGHGVDAGDVSEPGRRFGERADHLLDAGIKGGDLGADPVGVVEHHAQDRRVVVGEEPAQRLFEPLGVLACPALGQLRQRSRIALSGDQRVHHRPPGDAVQFREHRRDLDLGVLEQFFDALLFAGAVLPQGAAVAGEVAQPSDVGRMHQRGSAHAPLGHLGQPHRVGPIRLGPARHVLDLAGVDQPAVKPLGLQQVIHPLPVGTRRLHHHPLHPPLPQPRHHLQQLCRGRAVAAQLLHPPARPVVARHPHTRLQAGLAQI